MDEISALTADGHSRTRATELVIRAGGQGCARRVYRRPRRRSQRSDRARGRGRAVRAQPSRRGRLHRPDGGATNIGRFLTLFGPQGRNLRLAGLYDLAEEDHFTRPARARASDASLDRAQLASSAHVCVTDLEDEFIRSLTADGAEQ
jgi:hypothetical protein